MCASVILCVSVTVTLCVIKKSESTIPSWIHLLRMQVFEGIPPPYDKQKRMVVPGALRVLRLKPGRRVSFVVCVSVVQLKSLFGFVNVCAPVSLSSTADWVDSHMRWAGSIRYDISCSYG